ncbi:MAG: WD40/YVTN/BNR-like repeat-containing protein, partial [Armatimonadota bacterium]
IRVTGGKQWHRIGPQTYDMMGFNVHPTEPNVLLTSGHPGQKDPRPNPLGVEISRNGGQTWQPLAMVGLGDFHAMTISRADPKVLWAWNVSGRPGLYRSQDGGRLWEYLGDPLGSVFYLAAHPQRANVVFAGTGRGLAISENAGGSWRLFSPSLSGVPVTAVEVHPKNPQIIYAYAVKPDLGLVRSQDGGKQWGSAGFFLGDRDAIGNLALDPTDPQTLYFATHGGDIYRSRDGGKTQERWVDGGRVVAP